MARVNWQFYFMAIAHLVSLRSSCLSRKCGAILVKDKRIIATGYNGAPSGFEHCDTAGCLRIERAVQAGESLDLCRGIHAEQNAILQAASSEQSTVGSEMYSTVQPCVHCAKMIVNCGISVVHISSDYPHKMALEIFKEAAVPVLKVRQLKALWEMFMEEMFKGE